MPVVEPRLLEPFKVSERVRVHLLLLVQSRDLTPHVPLMDVDGDHRFDLLTVHPCPQVLQTPGGELDEDADALLGRFLHDAFLVACVLQRRMTVRKKEEGRRIYINLY